MLLLGLLISKVSLARDMFLFADPLSLIENAPMLLVLKESTLGDKADAWRHVLEPRVDVSWEEVHAPACMTATGFGKE